MEEAINFFLKLTLNGIIIKWNNSAFVTEQYQSNREKIHWFFMRNLRYGYSGNQIDKIIYQKKSYLIIFLKIIFLIFNIGFNLVLLKRKKFDFISILFF